MRRREFLGVIGSVAASSFPVHAQRPTIPVIGFVHLTSLEETRQYLAAFSEAWVRPATPKAGMS
jgi:hypothetical protein